MRPKVFLVFVTAMVASTAMLLAITRPPVPSNVPAGLDPNRIKGEIISVQQVEVGKVWTEEFGYWLPKDAGVTRSCDVGTVTNGRRWIDPNSGEKWAEFTVTYTPTVVGYDYVNFTCTPIPTDPNQAVQSDTRTVILEVSNPPLQGVIYLVNQPTGSVPFWLPHAKAFLNGRNDAQKVWQDASKLIMGMTDRQANDLLYWKYQRGEVGIPQ